ncbi:MAG TPA: preprotein translocase subunit SecA, partial [Saprospirales bacterium]|nr:preprotein translocase subunit SecA [Saprospirales bacterium]
YKTNKEKYKAVIDEVNKLTEAGRPVLVGTTSVDISERLSAMLDSSGISHNVLNAKQHQREAEVVSEAGLPSKVTIATNMAGRGTDIKLSQQVKDAGGLAIIATERHDSRRVDRQLRGRAGRQGDPGMSQFYVSLEDTLMRNFGSERVAGIMDKLGHKEGDVIQHSMVSKSIERAQKKVEENNFGVRKRLLEYDDVMNIQREAIYSKRNHALNGKRLTVDLNNMFIGLTENIVENNVQYGDYESFRNRSITALGIDPEITEDEFASKNIDDLIDMYQHQVNRMYGTKSKQIRDILLPTIKRVYEAEGHKYKRIAIPYTDGRAKQLNISAGLEEAIGSDGGTIMRDIEKAIMLALIDENWKEHLRAMDELKESSQSASFEQKDPLVIYKMESFNLFEKLMKNINYDVCSYLMKGKLFIDTGDGNLKEAKEQKTDLSKMQTNEGRRTAEEQAMRRAAAGAGRAVQKVETFKREQKKVGRNEQCPCGSSKKFKHCCGK